MDAILLKILQKYRTLVFSIIYRWRFGSLGYGAFIAKPFRLDGISKIYIGSKSVVQSRGWLYCHTIDEVFPAVLKIGDGCVLGFNNHITSVRKVIIGDYVLTANNVYISDNVHEFENIGCAIMHQPVKFKQTVNIGYGSWIGENVSIIGANIGRNCVIGANSVVTKDIPDFSVAVGCPAKVIRQYDLKKKVWIKIL